MNHLHGADPVYAEACKMPFEPVTTEQSNIVPLQTALKAHTDEIDAALEYIVEHEMVTSQRAYRALASGLTRLSPELRDYYIQEIKKRSGRTVKVVKDQLAYTRTQILKEHREQGILHEPAWKEYHGDNIVASVQNVTAMCEYHGIRLRYNEMSHGVDCDIPGEVFADDDVANLNLTYIRDLMVGYGLPYTRADEFMNTIAHENAYHPFRDYLDSIEDLPFDPSLPMFEKLMSTLTITHDEDAARTFVRRWFTSVVAAVRGHAGIGMKGVLTFSGKQGIGKTSWFRGIVHPSMFREGLILDPHNKDSLIAATEHLICEIGELDATFKKDIPAIKAFISNQSDKIRHPYAAKTSRHARMTVFCATVNEMDFLVDSTGNSRFWPIAVDDCNFRAIAEMKKLGQIDLLWKEFNELYNAAITGVEEAKWWVGQEDNKWLHESSEAFTKEAPGEVLLRKHYDMDAPATFWVTSTELTESLGLDPTDHGFVTRRTEVLAALRRITGQHVRRTFRRDDLVDADGNPTPRKGYLVPQRMLQKMKAQLSVVPSVAKPAESEFDFI